MQVSLSNHKSTESAIRNLEVEVGQLAKQLAETSMNSFGANTEKNPKEECKAIFTRSQRSESAKREKGVEVMQSYPTRAMDRRLQDDWARDARKGPRVLMSLRIDFGSMG